jgi:kinesin family protein 6/9
MQVSVNESVDPVVIIARLKQEVRDLKEEVALLKGNAPQRGPLTPDELQRLRQQLLAYVDEGQPGAAADSSGGGAGLNFGGDMMMIRASECPRGRGVDTLACCFLALSATTLPEVSGQY